MINNEARATFAYWWTGVNPGTVNNFGDEITPLLLNYFSHVNSVWAPVHRADVVATGSVLEHVPDGWDGHVIGSGRLFRDSDVSTTLRNARIWALRGPLSARNVSGDYAIGDPGLLADELISDDVETREFDLGVLPHWKDDVLAQRGEWLGSWSTHYISPGYGPLEVVSEIARCKKLVTSSLHGMIVADACGIPRRVEYSRKLDNEGERFKFEDYSAAIGTPMVFGKTVEANRFRVEDRKHQLYDAFAALGEVLCG